MIREAFTRLPRSRKRLLVVTFDFVAIVTSVVLAYAFRMEWDYLRYPENYLVYAFLMPLTTLPFCYRSGFYSAITRYSGIEIIGGIARNIGFGLITFLAVVFLWPDRPLIPRSVPVIYAFFAILLITGSRYAVGLWLTGESGKNIVYRMLGLNGRDIAKGIPIAIYGAGSAGRQLLAALKSGITYHPAALIDDDKTLHGTIVNGVKVYPSEKVADLVDQFHIQQVLLAIPSASHSQRRQLIEKLEGIPIQVKTMPGLDEIAQGKVDIQEIRDVPIADILGREPVAPRPELLAKCIENKAVMVTGAGGSIGAELCRQIIRLNPRTLVLYEIAEFPNYSIHAELEKIADKLDIKTQVVPVMGSVSHPPRLLEVMNHFGIDTIYHAAAYKHVPMVEYNSEQGFYNNLIGTLYTAQAAIINQVENFVLVSTDKAVRPTNMMGATKRLSELALQAMSEEREIALYRARAYDLEPGAKVPNNTRFTIVRFGNVLDSSGSVIPKFREQIREGGPVTVTHPDIIRYFMTMEEAAQLVIQAGSMGEGGDVFLLDMGEPVKIADLAEKLIRLSGLKLKSRNSPGGDIEIRYTGLRPGEKLYEELLIEDSAQPTAHEKIYRAGEHEIHWDDFIDLVVSLRKAFEHKDHQTVVRLLGRREIDYQPSGGISDWLSTPPSPKGRELPQSAKA
jgi:FlaA1/EpsC-like NDP-sugar epimerase